jgi:hypothetical protein
LYGEVWDHKEDSQKGCSEEGKEDKEVKREGFEAPLFCLWITQNVFSLLMMMKQH